MTRVVVDTDILIDFLRTNSGIFPKLLELQKQGNIEIYFSGITVMEIFAGESALKQKREFTKLFSNFNIVPFDYLLAEYAGEIKRGKKLLIPLADFIIGITALSLKAKIATRNKKHYTGLSNLKFFS